MLTGATIDGAASTVTAAGFTFDAGPGEQGAISIATQGTVAFANVTQGSAIDVEITFTAAGEDGALTFMVEAADEGEGARAINLNVLDPEAFMGDLSAEATASSNANISFVQFVTDLELSQIAGAFNFAEEDFVDAGRFAADGETPGSQFAAASAADGGVATAMSSGTSAVASAVAVGMGSTASARSAGGAAIDGTAAGLHPSHRRRVVAKRPAFQQMAPCSPRQLQGMACKR